MALQTSTAGVSALLLCSSMSIDIVQVLKTRPLFLVLVSFVLPFPFIVGFDGPQICG